jgi:hypothetical protein
MENGNINPVGGKLFFKVCVGMKSVGRAHKGGTSVAMVSGFSSKRVGRRSWEF